MRTKLTSALLTLASCTACNTTKPPSCADPGFMEQYARTRRFSLGRPRAIKVVPDGSAVLFLRSGKDTPVQDLYEFDTNTTQERLLLTAHQLLQGAEEVLSPEERAQRERARLSASGIASYDLSADGAQILIPLSGRLFVVDRSDGGVIELFSDFGYALDAQFSPNGEYISCVRDGDLFVTEIATGLEQQMTFGASKDITHALAEFVAQEEMGRRRGHWWSPDSHLLAYQKTDTESVEHLHILDATRPEKPPQVWPYPRAGRQNADVQLGLIHYHAGEPAGETVWVNWDRQRYPYLATVKWPTHAPLTILVQNRAQTEEALLTVETTTGDTATLLTETDTAWLNIDQSMPQWILNGTQFLWTTERDGVTRLEYRDAQGQPTGSATDPDIGFRRIAHLDHASNNLYFQAGDDPTQKHIYRIPLGARTGSNLYKTPEQLSMEPGTHSVTFRANNEDSPYPDRVYVHTMNNLAGERAQVVRRTDGTEIGRLRSVGENPPFVPQLELTTVGQSPMFHAAVIRPRNFSPQYRYPVIVYVYGGPHALTVQADPNRYLRQQWFADHGFIVVSIDGRGTPARGRAWERATKGNLIDIPLEDQVTALKLLGQKYPEMDLDRVGIYGWSFGGYFSAMAAMRRPDVFQAAVAGAPVADWRDYDTHYTERYMGLVDQNPKGYEAASVLTYADQLTVPLLIIHGTADDNVYFTHSLKLSDALFRAGKHYEMLVLSDFTHMVNDPLITTRLYERIVSFFEHHLQPPR